VEWMKNKEMWEIVINTFVDLELEQELGKKREKYCKKE
jgi:hypothetical protein